MDNNRHNIESQIENMIKLIASDRKKLSPERKEQILICLNQAIPASRVIKPYSVISIAASLGLLIILNASVIISSSGNTEQGDLYEVEGFIEDYGLNISDYYNLY